MVKEAVIVYRGMCIGRSVCHRKGNVQADKERAYAVQPEMDVAGIFDQCVTAPAKSLIGKGKQRWSWRKLLKLYMAPVQQPGLCDAGQQQRR